MTTLCYIGLGSNLANPLAQLEQALQTLRAHPAMAVIATSPWYGSKAVGPGKQADFINAVAGIETALTAPQLLDELQRIERQQGRTRELRWGPRSLDLDILLYGDAVIDSPRLTLPHPRLTQRPFVIKPLADIAPDLVLPDGTSLRSLLDYVSAADIWPLQPQDGE